MSYVVALTAGKFSPGIFSQYVTESSGKDGGTGNVWNPNLYVSVSKVHTSPLAPPDITRFPALSSASVWGLPFFSGHLYSVSFPVAGTTEAILESPPPGSVTQ